MKMNTLKLLKEIEIKIDAVNPIYGSRSEYCIYCKSTKYNSKIGIIHINKCPIFEIRDIINNHNINK